MKIATFQKGASLKDLSTRVATIRKDLEKCETQDVDIICFPECYLTGYRLTEIAAERCALKLDGLQLTSILGSWSHFGMTIILGLIEKAETGLFNTGIVIRGGELLGVYRKQQPNKKYFLAGNSGPVFRRDEVSFGINICNDANFPELALEISDEGGKNHFLSPKQLFTIRDSQKVAL